MDDMNAFERQVVGQIRRFAGPSRLVDDAAIFTTITATQPPKWRFQSMLGTAKFVIAGAVVALFGGLLLAGVLTTQDNDTLPAVGASASASARPDTTAQPTAATESMSPTTRTDILPGVSLLTQEVEPGILRILGDDAGHDLTEGHPDSLPWILDIAISPDGTPWIADLEPEEVGVPMLASAGRRVWALGQRGTYDSPVGPFEHPTLLAEPDGTITVVSGRGIFSLDGERFTPNPGSRQWETHEGSWWILDRDDLVAATGAEVGPRMSIGDPGALALFWPRIRNEEKPLDIGNSRWHFAEDSGTFVEPPGDGRWGPYWVIDGVLGYEDSELAGYEGGVLLVDDPDVPVPLGHYLADIYIEKLRLAPDGSIWAIGESDEGPRLYRIDPAEVAKT